MPWHDQSGDDKRKNPWGNRGKSNGGGPRNPWGGGGGPGDPRLIWTRCCGVPRKTCAR